MTTVHLTLEEIQKRRRKARQEGRHEALRIWEELERRAERESETGEVRS